MKSNQVQTPDIIRSVWDSENVEGGAAMKTAVVQSEVASAPILAGGDLRP